MAEQDDYSRITLRIPPALHDQLIRSASTASHSLNAEIIARLASTFLSTPSEAHGPDISKAIMETREMVEQLLKKNGG